MKQITFTDKLVKFTKSNPVGAAYIAAALDYYTKNLLANKSKFITEGQNALMNPYLWIQTAEQAQKDLEVGK